MKFELVSPCKDCPFRNDRQGFLTRGRAAEICRSMIEQDLTFSCHATNDFGEDGQAIETKRSQHCAGALILLEKLERPNQMMRIAERIGLYDRTRLKMDAPVFDTPEQMIDAQWPPRRRRKRRE